MSRYTQSKLDRLAREKKALHQQVIAGTLSVAAAYRAAGFAPQKTPLAHLRHWWAKASPEEQAEFRQTITVEVHP